MKVLIAIFAVLIAGVGWHYAFYSVAGLRLAALEARVNNRTRVLMRRAGGLSMLAMGVLFYLGFEAVRPEVSPRWFVAIWAAVLLLLIATIVLALLDLRLTRRLRQRHLPRDDVR